MVRVHWHVSLLRPYHVEHACQAAVDTHGLDIYPRKNMGSFGSRGIPTIHSQRVTMRLEYSASYHL